MEGLLGGSAGEEKEDRRGKKAGAQAWVRCGGEPGGGKGWQAGTGRAAQDTGGERGKVAQEGAERLGNGWAGWDAERWGGLRRR